LEANLALVNWRAVTLPNPLPLETMHVTDIMCVLVALQTFQMVKISAKSEANVEVEELKRSLDDEVSSAFFKKVFLNLCLNLYEKI
jgi:hypothetical protein